MTTADALGAGLEVAIRVNNSFMRSVDIPIVAVRSPLSKYIAYIQGSQSGYFDVRPKNITGGCLSEAVTINFTILRGGEDA